MAWILTPDALDDLDRLASEGVLQYGATQSSRYMAQMLDRFDSLAVHPYMVSPHDVDGMQLRLLPSGRHHILYVIDNEDVLILRVLHALQNWPDLI